MYCPKCAAEIDGVKFCRTCGANVSLVEQALTGKLPTVQEESPRTRVRQRRKGNTPTLESAFSHMFTGFAFVVCAFAIWRFFPGGAWWWFWMLIPAFATFGEGMGKFIRIRNEQREQDALPAASPSPQATALPKGATTSNLDQPSQDPSSIVEHTTYHLK